MRIWPLMLAACVLAGGATLAAGRSLDAAIGKALFERIWTVAGASNQASDGLGPLFNARACASCHPGAGAGRLADGPGLVLRFADDPTYGRQLQTTAVQGERPEGELALSWRYETRILGDGTLVQLRAPVWRIEDPAILPLPRHGSLRLAPSLAGLGRVEAALDARSGQGFGLEADHADLAGPVQEALLLDLGLSTAGRPQPWGDCTPREEACRAGPHGAGDGGEAAELSPPVVAALLAYLRSLPPPRPSGEPDPDGLRLFADIGCAGCHRPHLASLAPFSDFRAHDLGEGLADGDPADPRAGRWRTAPLWGLGRKLAERRPLLHDGRARDAIEAILWHDGSASRSAAAFALLAEAERARLLKFLGGL
jgi:CxxC motif-containing protein (DUF1111 family)